MKADDHLREGDIDAARAELVAEIKRAPADQGARIFLFQLLCICGEWDKALAQVRALAQLSPEAQMLATAYGQAIAAERTRADAFAGRGGFAVLAGRQPWTDDLCAALQAFAVGDEAEGAARRDSAFEAVEDTPGEVDGQPFDWIADADGRFGPTLEVILNGRWGLLPVEALEEVRFEPAGDLRDLVWAPGQIRLKSGGGAAGLFPVRYPGSEHGGGDIRLARATRWERGPSGEEGRGQRLLVTDAGEERTLLSISRLAMR